MSDVRYLYVLCPHIVIICQITDSPPKPTHTQKTKKLVQVKKSKVDAGETRKKIMPSLNVSTEAAGAAAVEGLSAGTGADAAGGDFEAEAATTDGVDAPVVASTGFVLGERMREAVYINLGLLALKKCIEALNSGSTYVPFQDSKLTMVGRDSQSVLRFVISIYLIYLLSVFILFYL